MRSKLPFFLFLAVATATAFLGYAYFHPAPKTAGAQASHAPFAILAAPSIRWTAPPQPSEGGQLHFAFRAEGSAPLAKLYLQVTPQSPPKGVRVEKEQHEVPTWLMGNKSVEWEGDMDLTGSLLAGRAVTLQIGAEDEDHRQSVSENVTLTLPEYHFTQPLAQALYTLRRSLQEDPQNRRTDALRALAGLLQQRPTFENRQLTLLTLRSAAVRIALDNSQEGLQSALDLLWHAAQMFEENPSSNVTVSLRLVPHVAPPVKPE